MANEYSQVAEQFGQALAAGNFVLAHEFLTEETKNEYSPAALEQEVKDMTAYSPGPIFEVEVMSTLEDWPSKRVDEVLWAYVALSGDSYSEGVAVTLANTPAGVRLREIVWGRP